jgi:hypothetical protein
MKRATLSASLILLACAFSSSAILAAGKKQPPSARELDMCAPPPGASRCCRPSCCPGHGLDEDVSGDDFVGAGAQFFLQGISQILSFWFIESERSCLQALQYDPNMAMAHWCIALSAAGDYRPAFQLLRNTANAGAGRGGSAPGGRDGRHGRSHRQRRGSEPAGARARSDRQGDGAARQGDRARAALHRIAGRTPHDAE